MSDGLSDERKIQVFSGLLEREVLEWFLGSRFSSWLELETDFLQTWCVVMTATDAIVDVAKLYQKENEHIRVYASNLKNIVGFSKQPSQRRP